MSYIEDSLSVDERIVRTFEVRRSDQWSYPITISILSSFFFFMIYIFTFALPWLLIGLIVLILTFLYVWFYHKNKEMGVTTKRFIYKKGIIAVKTQEIHLHAIETVTIKQGVLDRTSGSGQIIITGRGTSELTLYVRDVMDVKKTIESQLPSINREGESDVTATDKSR